MLRALASSLLLTSACASAPPPAAHHHQARPGAATAAPGASSTTAPDAFAAPASATPPATFGSSGSSASGPATSASAAPVHRRHCTGSVSIQLQQELSRRAQDVTPCYEQLLQRAPESQGVVLVKVRVSSQGAFEEASLSKDEIGQPDFAQCILASFRAPVATRVEGDCVEVNIPLRFEPKRPSPPENGAPDAAPSDG